MVASSCCCSDDMYTYSTIGLDVGEVADRITSVQFFQIFIGLFWTFLFLYCQMKKCLKCLATWHCEFSYCCTYCGCKSSLLPTHFCILWKNHIRMVTGKQVHLRDIEITFFGFNKSYKLNHFSGYFGIQFSSSSLSWSPCLCHSLLMWLEF